jgi:pimeloyl-ACP methyl ester carboxylesterase
MVFLPLIPLLVLLIGLVSLLLLGFGLYFVIAWLLGGLVGLVPIISGAIMLALSALGRPLVLLLLRRPAPDEPKESREGVEVRRIQRPDGTELQVELYGNPNGQPLIFTHGWGVNSTEWYYAKKALAQQFRLVVWDLPGLGKSAKPADNNYSLEKLAGDLEVVVSAVVTDKPAILVGHSIGGMMTLTFCRLFPQHLGRTVSGLVLMHTTYTNPVRTASLRGFLQAIQKPVLEPLMHLTIWLSPLVWLMNWMSYFNGTSHIVSAITGFAGTESRGQLDLGSRYIPEASPAVLARGMLGMFRFEETQTLPTINVPVLIIAGDLDRLTNPDASEYMQRAIRKSQLLVLGPSGHMSNFERHGQFTDALMRFGSGLAKT